MNLRLAILLTAFVLSNFAHAGRTLIVPTMRYRPTLVTQNLAKEILKIDASKNRASGIKEITLRFRVELTNISSKRQPIFIEIQPSTYGEAWYTQEIALHFPSLVAATVPTFTLEPKENAASCSYSGVIDYVIDTENKKHSIFMDNAATPLATSAFTYPAPKDVTELLSAFTLSLHIRIDADQGAVVGTIGSLLNVLDGGPLLYDRVLEGAVGTFPLNGGRPF